jgi:deoxyribose-phosphate aldolase
LHKSVTGYTKIQSRSYFFTKHVTGYRKYILQFKPNKSFKWKRRMKMGIEHMIDHTMLKADAGKDTIIRYCNEAREHKFASVCVNTCFVPLVAEQLKGSGVKTCCVAGFPLGAMLTSAKAFEASEAVKAGADEVDMVINISALKDGDDAFVEEDIRAVVKASGGAVVKVIIETCLLTDEEKVRACQLAVKAGADFVKTSTGFSTGGATAADVALMRKTVGGKAGVKASGGIRTPEDAAAMIEAGADRIGAGNGIVLI